MSMSNEELALLVQQGDTGAAAELWENCRRLIQMLAWRYYNAHAAAMSGAGVELDDLDQEGYFVMLDAVEAFSQEKGYSFNTYLSFQARSRFDRLCGLHGRREPANSARSMDDPLGDEEDGMVFGDVLADPNAAADLDDVAELDEREGIARDVWAAVGRLPEPDRMVIRMRYYRNASYAGIAEKVGKTAQQVQRIHTRALAALGRDRQMQNTAERLGILPPVGDPMTRYTRA